MIANKHWPIITFVIILVLLGFGLTQDPHLLPSNLVEKPAPKFRLPGLVDGKVLDESLFQGHRTIVNVWASWCEPCREEHPIFGKIRAAHPGLKLFAIDYKDDSEQAKHFLEVFGNPFDWVAQDAKGSIALDWGIYGTPETFILDERGRILHRHAGALSWETWQREFEPLLKPAKKKDA